MSLFTLNPSDPFQARAIERLTNESTIWLTTTSADGTPQPNPIWFLWDGAETVVMYSLDAAKTRHIAARPRVALSFNTDQSGDNVVVFAGSATIDHSLASAAENEAYVAKYRVGMEHLNYTPERFAAEYRVPIIVKLEKLRGF